MDSEDAIGPSSHEDRRAQQVDNAIRAIKQKKPLPEIDFTIHTMEDGTQVSTLERVCKGMPPPAPRCRTTRARRQSLFLPRPSHE